MLWDIALKNLWRRKLRTILAILGVATAVQLYLMISGILTTYEQDTQRQLSAFAGKIVVEQQMEGKIGIADFTSSGSSLKAVTAEELLALEGIDRSSSSAMIFIPIARSNMPYMPPAVVAVGIEPGHEKAFLGSFGMESGSAVLHGPYDVILGQNAAKYYQPEGSELSITTGQTIEIQGQTLSVVGVLKQAPQIFSNAVILPLETAQKIFDRSNIVSSVILTAARVEDTQALKTEITTRFPTLTASTQDDMTKNANVMLEGMNYFMSLIKNSIIVVAIIVITIVVFVAVMEQRREIGILRAIGANRWRIFSLIAGESMIISLLGATLALPFAVVYVQWGMSKFNTLPGVLSVWGQSIAVAAVIGLIASILPAWKAVHVEPLEALRYE